LGRTGLEVSRLCLGAMTFGEGTGFMKGVVSDDAEARSMLDRALERGLDFVDTADLYGEGTSEQLLGEWLGPRRKDVIVATKCRFKVGPSIHDQGLSRRHILKACEDSLRRLRTDWIDLYQVHMQQAAVPIEETLRALDDLQRAGKIRYAGCSNYAGYRLTESLWVSDVRNLLRYESVQLQWSLIERGAEREMIPACRAFGLAVMTYSPLGRGILSGKYQRGAAPPAGTRLAEWKDAWRRTATDQTWAVLDAVTAVAKELGSSPGRVAIAWLLHKPEVTSVILGARTVAQLDDNIAAAELKLTAEQLAVLDKASLPAWGYPYDFIGVRGDAW
jgi:aryl-alcohol dehydrogenase-like predicted oxidoreductase